MGLTIHWEFEADCLSPEAARKLVQQLHAQARLLPFEFVGENIEECCGANCAHCEPEEGLRWMKLLGHRYIQRGEEFISVAPEHLYAFVTSPGTGCEPAVFGLARYPQKILVEGKMLPTGFQGWSWCGSCKTQYASNPAEGGIDHFLQSHITLVQLLDAAKDLGILRKVADEGGFWDNRDTEALAKTVGKWNHLAARVAGHWKDSGQDVKAPITEYPNFEHLEAQDPTE